MPGPHSNPIIGKTSTDRRSGKAARHLRNMQLRREWNQEYMREAKTGGKRIIPYPEIGK